MPQLSLYLDSITYKQMEKAAKLANQSLSKWVRLRITTSFENDWPEEYFKLFGSIKDPDFNITKITAQNFKKDIKREQL